MYETIHTGLPSSEHEIVANSIVRIRRSQMSFSLCVRRAKSLRRRRIIGIPSCITARHTIILTTKRPMTSLNIQHGRFYTEDEYPDVELFNSAAHLVRKFSPDYLLLHPMGMDYFGETFGSDTKEYRNHATYQDLKLAPLILEWKDRGYTIFVTGDHGINKDGSHGGTTPEQRTVPFFVIQPTFKGRGEVGDVISHLQIAPTTVNLLKYFHPRNDEAKAFIPSINSE